MKAFCKSCCTPTSVSYLEHMILLLSLEQIIIITEKMLVLHSNAYYAVSLNLYNKITKRERRCEEINNVDLTNAQTIYANN